MKRITILFITFWLLPYSLNAQSGFSQIFDRYEFAFEDELQNIFTEDLNQDGLTDILIMTKSSETKPLLIFFQKAAGFSQIPDQSLVFNKNAILFDLGDIDKKYPGVEIAYLTTNTIEYYNLEEGRYHSEAKKWADISSLLQSTSPECPVRGKFIYSFNQKESKFLFIPAPDKATALIAQDGKLIENQTIAVKSQYATSTSFKESEEDPGMGNLTQKISVSVPKIYFEDFNGDTRKDFITIFKDKIKVFLQQESDHFSPLPDFEIDLEVLSEEEKKKALKPVYKAEVTDLNEDGYADIVVTKNTIKTSSGFTKIYIHMNQSASIQKVPDQIMMLESSFGTPQILDLNGDQQKDLVIAELKFGLLQFIKILITKKAGYKECVYFGEDGKFPQYPAFKLKSQIEFDFENPENMKGDFIHFEGDFNGDGVKDLLKSSSKKGFLSIFPGNLNNKNLFSKKATIKIKDSELPLQYIIKDLNQDKISDIILDFKINRKKKMVVYLSK